MRAVWIEWGCKIAPGVRNVGIRIVIEEARVRCESLNICNRTGANVIV